MNILITICARGGSKGIPGKNIKKIAGTPLLHYTIKCAQQFAIAAKTQNVAAVDIILSTDNDEIKNVASYAGLHTEYLRPAVMATDKAGKRAAIEDVLNYNEKQLSKIYDYVLDMDVTSPLRSQKDLFEGLEMMEADKTALTIFSVNPANRNPYFNMVEATEDGYCKIVKEVNPPYTSRQAAPDVYDMNASFYFYRRAFFDTDYQTAITPKSLVFVMQHICFDLDHPEDFDYMSYLFENYKLDFLQ